MAYKIMSCSQYVPLENEEVSERDIEFNIEEEETIRQLFKKKPDIEGIFREQSSQSIIDEAVHSHNEHTDCSSNQTLGDQTCFSCVKKCNFKSGHDIKRGMHLVYGRYLPITKVNDAMKKAVYKTSQLFGFKQPFLYEHHAIISEVIGEPTDGEATVKLVEFTSVGSFTFQVIESDTPVVIKVETDSHIFYKEYKNMKYSPDEIVDRARSRIGEGSYKLLSHNCEHVAVWCVSGEEQSFQSEKAKDKMFIPICSWLDRLISIVKPYRFLKFTAIGVGAIFTLLFSGLLILIDLISSIVNIIKLRNQWKKGLMCHTCYIKRKRYLIAKIICSSMASLVMLIVPTESTVLVAVVTILLGLVGCFILPSLVSYLYGKIKKLCNPLDTISKMVVRKHENIEPGDVLNIPTDHDIIVKDVRVLPRTKVSCLQLEVVHFAFNGPLSKRTVKKDSICFEINDHKLKVFMFCPSDVYSDDEVVERALKKVGDDNFSSLYYRSSHMSKFCKVRNYRDDYWRSFNTIPAIEREVTEISDVKPGDMINFRYFGLPHVGIVVGKLPIADLVEIDFYQVEGGMAKCCTQEFDLNSNKILRHNYYEDDRFPLEETLEKAAEKEGEKVYPFRCFKSARLVRDCVLKTEK